MPGLLAARVKLPDFGCLFEDFSSSTDCSGAAAAGWGEELVVTGVLEDLQGKINT